MPYDISLEPLSSLATDLSAAADRRSFVQRIIHVAPGLEIKTDVLDPSGGANYSGGSSYSPEMPLIASEAGLANSFGMFAQDPLRCLGSFDVGLAGFDQVEGKAAQIVDDSAKARTQDFQRVLMIATQPGTPVAGAMARKLAEKSLKLADLAEQRARVVQSAREGYHKSLRETEKLDVLTERALQKGDTVKAAEYRKKAFEEGRKAVRYQKVNALATGMTENAAAQAGLAQEIAEAVLAGRPDLVAVYGVAYDQLGGATEDMRQIRAEQIEKAKTADLQGFSSVFGFAGLDNVFEGELNRMENEEFGYAGDELGELGRLFKGRIRKKIKKGLKKGLKKVGGAVKTAAQAVGKVAAKLTVGLPCKLMQSKMMKGVVKGAATAVGSFYGGPVGGAVGSRAADRASKVDKAMCGAAKKIGLDGSKKFDPGAIKGALKSTAKTIVKDSLNPKEALKTLTSVGTAYIGGAAAGGALTKAGGSIAKTVAKQAGKTVLKQVQGKIPVLNKIPVADALAVYSSGGGGDLLKFGAQAVSKMGLPQAAQQAYLKRMSQVAIQQVANRNALIGQLGQAGAMRSTVSNLVAGALRA